MSSTLIVIVVDTSPLPGNANATQKIERSEDFNSMEAIKVLLFALILVTLATGAEGQTGASPSDATAQSNTAVATASAASDDSSVPVEAAFTTEQKSSPVSAHRDGLWFSTADGATKLHVHGYIQGDDRMFSAALTERNWTHSCSAASVRCLRARCSTPSISASCPTSARTILRSRKPFSN